MVVLVVVAVVLLVLVLVVVLVVVGGDEVEAVEIGQETTDSAGGSVR